MKESYESMSSSRGTSKVMFRPVSEKESFLNPRKERRTVEDKSRLSARIKAPRNYVMARSGSNLEQVLSDEGAE